MRVRTPDPIACPTCRTPGRVIDSRAKDGYRYRRHTCPACGARWTTYQFRLRSARRLRIVTRQTREITM